MVHDNLGDWEGDIADVNSSTDYLAYRAFSLVTEAGSALTVAGKHMLIIGRANKAIELLDHACALLASVNDLNLRATALETLLTAQIATGRARAAVGLAAMVDELECAGLEPGRLVMLRIQLAWADVLACEPARGIARVHDARAMLTGQSSELARLSLDTVECWLLAQAKQDEAARQFAATVVAATRDGSYPQLECRAWEVLGTLARPVDPAESTACFRRARALAQQHRLPARRLRVQLELGINEWIVSGETTRLIPTQREAERLHILPVSCMAGITVALDMIFRGLYPEADRLIGQCLAQAHDAGLTETLRWAIMARSVLAGHQRKRGDMESALEEAVGQPYDDPYLLPLTLALSAAVCSLLEENREQAIRDLHRAILLDADHPGPFPMTGWDDLELLLGPAAARAAPAHDSSTGISMVGMPFWSRPFTLLGRAAALGRAGRHADALAEVAQAEQVMAPYGLLHHMGLRIIAEVAYQDGWGVPGVWLRKAEAFFYNLPVPAVSNACRALLQRIGAPAPQHRRDTYRVPRDLRALGVTVREHEVLNAIADRKGNKEIARLLYISPRTVEKHIASLLAKTGLPNRKALVELSGLAKH
jgi:DNA-binding CsgD family transcriptional regulator/tetratricopeptide (TPR) repeat protein